MDTSRLSTSVSSVLCSPTNTWRRRSGGSSGRGWRSHSQRSRGCSRGGFGSWTHLSCPHQCPQCCAPPPTPSSQENQTKYLICPQTTDTYLYRVWFLYIIGVSIKCTVGCSEDVAGCYDRSSAVGGHLSWRHQAHLQGI